MAIQPEVTAGGSRQRVLVLAVAGVLLVVLVALVARPLLLGGTQAPAAAPTGTAGAAPTTVTQLIRPSTSVAGPTAGTGKDPFRPAAGAVTTVTTVTTAAPTTTSAAGAAGGAATVSGSGTTAQRAVALEKVSSKAGKRYVKVSVDGTSYTAAQGDSFADDYLVVDVGSSCATFESPSGRFTLCEGESVLKLRPDRSIGPSERGCSSDGGASVATSGTPGRLLAGRADGRGHRVRAGVRGGVARHRPGARGEPQQPQPQRRRLPGRQAARGGQVQGVRPGRPRPHDLRVQLPRGPTATSPRPTRSPRMSPGRRRAAPPPPATSRPAAARRWPTSGSRSR